MKIALLIFLSLTLIGPLWILFTKQIDFNADWRTANRESAKLAPDPKIPEAIIQAYSARAFNWRGIFGTHTWIATKNKDDTAYTVYQVIGWRLYYHQPPLVIQKDLPDRNWFGQKPTVILDIRGTKAEELIPKIYSAAQAYPDAHRYELWPGPNSNTFPAYIGRAVPELGLTLPATAMGKDLLLQHTFFTRAPSGTGYQFSLYGLLGLIIAKEEGIEVNILGLVYGIKPKAFAIELPGIGQIPAGKNPDSSL
jgi:hypothetical protein